MPLTEMLEALCARGMRGHRIHTAIDALSRKYADELDRCSCSLASFLTTLLRRRAFGDGLQVLAALEQAYGHSDALHAWRGTLLAAQGRLEEVPAALAPRGGLTAGHFLRAGTLAAAGSPEAGLFLFGLAARLAPADLVARERLGACEARLGRPEGLARLREVEADTSLGGEALCLLGEEAAGEGRLAEARRRLEAAVRAGHPAPATTFGMALVWAHEGSAARAARAVSVGVEAPLLEAPQLSLLSQAAGLLDDIALIRRCQRRLAAAPAALGPAAMDVATALAQVGQLRGAVEVLREVVGRRPAALDAWERLGELHAALGDHVAAAEALRQQARLQPKEASVHLRHGRQLLLAGRGAQGARAAFARALALAPASVEALQGQVQALEADDEACPTELSEALWRLHARQPEATGVAERCVVAALAAGLRTEEAEALLSLLAGPAAAGVDVRLRVAAKLAATQPRRASAVLQPALAVPEVTAGVAQQVARLDARAGQLARAAGTALVRMPLPAAAVPAAPTLTFSHAGRQICGTVVGSNFAGRCAIVTPDGQNAWAPWGCLPPSVPSRPLAAGSGGGVYRLGRELIASLDVQLARPRLAPHLTASTFIEAFARHGPCYVVGGVVRDLLGADHARPQPELNSEGDIDLAVGLPPNLVVLVGGQLARGVEGAVGRPAGIVSPYTSEFFGLVSFAARQHVAAGRIDVLSMRAHGAHTPASWVVGARGRVLPLAFADDIAADAAARDFTLNALYIDPVAHTLVDPTGHGLADLRRRRLRLCSLDAIVGNEDLGFRFCKMRRGGFTASARCRSQVRAHFVHFTGGHAATSWLARALRRASCGDGHGSEAFWAQTCAVLAADGLGDIADRLSQLRAQLSPALAAAPEPGPAAEDALACAAASCQKLP